MVTIVKTVLAMVAMMVAMMIMMVILGTGTLGELSWIVAGRKF